MTIEHHVLEATESTNSAALALVGSRTSKAPLIVSARQQTKGRGRKGKSWLSGEGNLCMSLLCFPSISLTHTTLISLGAGVAVLEAIGASSLQLKWPNDIMIHHKKLGGILVETGVSGNKLAWAVIGIGLNILHKPSDEAVDVPATSLLENNIVRQVDTLAPDISDRILYELSMIEKGQIQTLLTKWLSYDAYRGQAVSIEQDGAFITGRYDTITESGALILQTDEGASLEITHAYTLRGVNDAARD